MSLAILLNSFLLRVARFNKTDAIVYGILAIIWIVMPSNSQLSTAVVSLFTSPAMIMIVAYTAASEGSYKKKSLDDGEYMALLFCRPLTRANYVFTKWIVAALAVQWFVWTNLLIYTLMRSVHGEFKLDLINGYELANLIVNSLSFSAMMMFVRSLPLKLAIWIFLGLFYFSMFVSTGAVSYESADIANDFASTTHSIRDALAAVINQFIFPAIDIETALTTTRFSYLPFVTYLSNISLYLLLATMILCRREFSYSYD